jgi:site-specific recombinase XerD
MKTNAVRAFMRFCVEEHLIPRCDIKFRQIREPLDNTFKNRVDLDLILDWLSHIPTKSIRLALVFQLEEGLRISEIINMKFNWIDWELHTLTVTGKRKHKRTIPLDDSGYELLYDYVMEFVFKINVNWIELHFAHPEKSTLKLTNDEKRLYQIIYEHNPALFKTEKFSLKMLGDERFFRTTKSSNMPKSEYRRKIKDLDPREAYRLLAPYKRTGYFIDMLRRLNDRLGIPEIIGKRYTSHFNRGNCATYHSEAGMVLDELQDLLGHASPVTTRCYVKKRQEQMHEDMNKTRFITKLPPKIISR